MILCERPNEKKRVRFRKHNRLVQVEEGRRNSVQIVTHITSHAFEKQQKRRSSRMMRESQDDTVPRHRVQTSAPTNSFIDHVPRKDKRSSRAPQSPESDKAPLLNPGSRIREICLTARKRQASKANASFIHHSSTDGMPMPMVRRVWAFRHTDTDWVVITGMSRVYRAETLRFCQARLPNRRFGEDSINVIRF